jgi:hypothetical protein
MENKLAIETKQAKIENINSLLATKELLAPCTKSVFVNNTEMRANLSMLGSQVGASADSTIRPIQFATVPGAHLQEAATQTNNSELPDFSSLEEMDGQTNTTTAPPTPPEREGIDL